MAGESPGATALAVRLAAAYAAILAVLILLGIPVALLNEDYPGDAVRMPVASALIAAGLGAAAFGFLRRANWARLTFFVLAPWGSLALASGFADWLWDNDIPWTQFLWIVYAPLVFALTRPAALATVGIANSTWVSRGAALLLGCAAVMLLARWGVVVTKPTGGGGGFFGQLVAMNAYVQRLVITIVPFWHYLYGFIAALIPAGLAAALRGRLKA